MFKVKPLTASDFGFAVELANTMDWNMAAEDFTFMASLEPDGSFLLVDDSKRVGIATCISYGKVGWFGNLIVDETSRRKGAGRMLVQHALALFTCKRCRDGWVVCLSPTQRILWPLRIQA